MLDLNVLWYLQKTRRGSNLINKVEYMERKLAILNTVENGLQLANAARGSVNIGFRRALSGSVDKQRSGPGHVLGRSRIPVLHQGRGMGDDPKPGTKSNIRVPNL